ncbi:MAG: methyltransferase, partial [Candidatus Komeilibacteria bacterium]|nr:methyltransferase [Candidatus Komeilibacteria bacterium]
KPQPKFIAADISVPALTLARHNAKLHGTKINFIKSDLLNNLKSCPDWIIANLPYLAPADLSKKLIKTDSVLSLGFEPRRALFADSTDGLAAFKKLFSQIKKRGQCPQKLYLEFHPPHQAQLRKIIKQFFPKANIVTLADYSGQQRFLTINF